MDLETKRYAQQYIANVSLLQAARMTTWQDVTASEIKKFIHIILLTGILNFPTIEEHWKTNKLLFHPIFHEIQM